MDFQQLDMKQSEESLKALLLTYKELFWGDSEELYGVVKEQFKNLSVMSELELSEFISSYL